MHRSQVYSIYLLTLALASVVAFGIRNHSVSPRPPHASNHLHSRNDPLVPPLRLIPAMDSSNFWHDPLAVAHPHGEKRCASGCAVSRHPTDRLTQSAFFTLLKAYQQSPPIEANGALEEILFYSRQSREYWRQQRADCLDPMWQRVLDDELEKTHVLVSLRVRDESGQICSKLTRVRVPLDRRHVFQMQSEGLPPLVTSGTVKRVGLNHLWTRL
ncbi:MAG: hypothetical protein CMJ74_13015 [Planctomycetaceae bacterium]|nr:hypothetical protein [Planctomycetaceae bacterium]